jgi:phenol 2-monooxygenase
MLIIPHSDFPSTGRYRVLVLTSDDLLNKDGSSARALEVICSKAPLYFPHSLVEVVVIHPFTEQRFEWTDIPLCIKENAEMQFHGVGVDDVYGIYGVDVKQGAIAVVRPDGYIGLIATMNDAKIAIGYLQGCLFSTE